MPFARCQILPKVEEMEAERRQGNLGEGRRKEEGGRGENDGAANEWEKGRPGIQSSRDSLSPYDMGFLARRVENVTVGIGMHVKISSKSCWGSV